MTPCGIDDIFSYAKALQHNLYRFYSELAGHFGRDQVDWLFEHISKRTQQDFQDVCQLHLDLTGALEARTDNGIGPNPLAMQWMSDHGGTPAHGGTLPHVDPLAELTGNETTGQLVARAALLEDAATTLFTSLSDLVEIDSLRQVIVKVADNHRTHGAQCQQLAAMLNAAPTPANVQTHGHAQHTY